jgi:hypothetical protein
MRIVPKKPNPSPARRNSGPRTLQGKARSRLNALKHGLFLRVALLEGESGAEYGALLEGLRADLKPEGLLEEIAVKDIANNVWRRRRLIEAEAGEIRRSSEFLQWDQERMHEQTALQTRPIFPVFDEDHDEATLIRRKEDPLVIEKCIELLSELRRNIEIDGFKKYSDSAILTRVYGARDYLCGNISDSYDEWLHTAEAPEEERKLNGYATPEKCKESILREIDGEIDRLERHQKVCAAIESRRIEVERLRFRIPDAPGLDRILRYDAHLGRESERLLTRLERLQRARLGQPAPPAIDVRVSS